jgi:hypothetical protein
MKISVYNIYTDTTENFIGEPEQVHAQLLMKYPFLRTQNKTLKQDIEYLAMQQAFMVTVE